MPGRVFTPALFYWEEEDGGIDPSTSSSSILRLSCKPNRHKSSRTPLQWFLFLLSACISFTHYFCYDMPGSTYEFLGQRLRTVYDERTFQYGYSMLYSAYSIPNIILPILVGILIEWRKSQRFVERLLIFQIFLMTMGQILYSYGTYRADLWLMIPGRLLYGVGGESIWVIQARLCATLIKPNSDLDAQSEVLAATLGALSAVAQFGSVTCYWTMPRIARSAGLETSNFVGVLLCLGCLAISFVLRLLRPKKSSLKSVHTSGSATPSHEDNKVVDVGCLFGLKMLLLALIYFIYAGIVYPFSQLSTAFYLQPKMLGDIFKPEQFPIRDTLLSFLTSFPENLSILLSLVQLFRPHLFRSFNRPLRLTIFCGVFYASAHLYLCLMKTPATENPLDHSLLLIVSLLSPLFLMGLGATAFMWGWGLAPTLLPAPHQTMAYGMMTATMNLAIASFPPLMAWILLRWGMSGVTIVFTCFGLMGFLLSLCLLRLIKNS